MDTGQPPSPSPQGGGGPCPEMLQVAEEAFRGGQFSLAAEILSSQLAELPQPERGLCLRQGEALARAGRMAEALEAYSSAARLARLRPEELRGLAESFALSLRRKELGLPPWKGKSSSSNSSNNKSNGGSSSEKEEGESFGEPLCCRAPEPLGCPRCQRLLYEPVTLHCGHTHCKRCCFAQGGGGGGSLGAGAGDWARGGGCCSCSASSSSGLLRVNVVLGNLLEKWFPGESRARRLALEGEALRERQELPAALEKYNQALESGEEEQ